VVFVDRYRPIAIFGVLVFRWLRRGSNSPVTLTRAL
jgi:hypothetical protein